MRKRASTGCGPWRSARGGRSGFPPLQRAEIVRLACLEPIAAGLHITHWSSPDLAREAVRQQIVSAISERTVRRLLHEVDLQPHRTRYWKTSAGDPNFKRRAEQVLWCYGNAASLAHHGQWVVCVDEIPNFQIKERRPLRRAIPGHIEHQEFEYTRHGTVTMLVFLVVHTGHMELEILESKSAAHYIAALQRFRRRHRHVRETFLIQDNDPTHTAHATAQYFAKARDWWRDRYTPVHASWLNQAEILIHAFGHRYLKRQSWENRGAFVEHTTKAWPEYNDLYAKPIEWTWTNHKMRRWYAEHAS
jgi:hypothetical protein